MNKKILTTGAMLSLFLTGGANAKGLGKPANYCDSEGVNQNLEVVKDRLFGEYSGSDNILSFMFPHSYVTNSYSVNPFLSGCGFAFRGDIPAQVRSDYNLDKGLPPIGATYIALFCSGTVSDPAPVEVYRSEFVNYQGTWGVNPYYSATAAGLRKVVKNLNYSLLMGGFITANDCHLTSWSGFSVDNLSVEIPKLSLDHIDNGL